MKRKYYTIKLSLSLFSKPKNHLRNELFLEEKGESCLADGAHIICTIHSTVTNPSLDCYVLCPGTCSFYKSQ